MQREQCLNPHVVNDVDEGDELHFENWQEPIMAS